MSADSNKPSKKARELALQGCRGWLNPEGEFFECPEVQSDVLGLHLGAHEQAAVDWLEKNRPDLFDKLETKRISRGYETWQEAAESKMIKRFMQEHSFERVAEDILGFGGLT